ncbi:MAG: radical SAM protein [Oscillospiraceae bacterium]|nr:radical SAM protein [Oscillospiraceae bacterium]
MEQFDLEGYLAGGVERIVKRAVKATLKDPKESAFMLKYGLASKEAAKRRAAASENGGHIPPFLIASITSSCNLHCAGCYARHNNACSDDAPSRQLSDFEWLKIFGEAKELGIGFILLAGGEPLIRRDIVEAAGKIPEILFPIFTNGTLIDEKYIELFDSCRNLIPVFSIEGRMEITDDRRGPGVYKKLIAAMDAMHKNGLFFGASVTVTKSNIAEVVSEGFLDNLYSRGCKVVFYVEYVPVEKGSEENAPGDSEREFIYQKLRSLREEYEDMLFLSFPGDEKDSGGCLAAGRGFFHINSHGGAEPCPFSPYSDINVRDTSLKEALRSKLFTTLREQHMLSEEHIGGCTLFEQRDKVEAILQNR